MIKILGYKESSGEYNGKSYSNFKIYMLHDNDPQCNGYAVFEEKVKISDWSKITGTTTPEELLGHEVELQYTPIGKQMLITGIKDLI